ncbi:unnamed protein product [Chilo suppressalis]|uniref:Signal peptidase complex subunit 2 n=1 Tax=Chilo suppressalis TaxID=168631 RepID=A0ABN8EDK2_CHISP|nr:unnamed protein product [Chilo suppressalis]
MTESTEVVKINKWDGAAAKNAIDDAIREVFTGDLKCKESFALIDGRLFLCALAVGVALYALLWDYLYPFPQSRLVLIICVSSYFILMGILTLYTTFKEKGIFVVAKEKVGNNNRVWEASSYVKKHDDKYSLVVVMREAGGAGGGGAVPRGFCQQVVRDLHRCQRRRRAERRPRRDH